MKVTAVSLWQREHGGEVVVLVAWLDAGRGAAGHCAFVLLHVYAAVHCPPTLFSCCDACLLVGHVVGLVPYLT